MPLRKNTFFNVRKKFLCPLSRERGGGLKALVAGPLRIIFFCGWPLAILAKYGIISVSSFCPRYVLARVNLGSGYFNILGMFDHNDSLHRGIGFPSEISQKKHKFLSFFLHEISRTKCYKMS